jgi:hypothetical protein
MCLRLICNLFSSSPPPRYQFVTKSYRAVYFAVLLSSITLGREGGRGSVLSVLLSKRKGKPNLPSPFLRKLDAFHFQDWDRIPPLYSALSWSMYGRISLRIHCSSSKATDDKEWQLSYLS